MGQTPTQVRRRPLTRRGTLVAVVAAVAVVLPGTGALGRAQAGAQGAAGTIDSVAGTTVGSRQYGFSGDGGPAGKAQLYHPRAVAFDGVGNVYVADTLNQRIRRIDPSGRITTFAGTGTEGYSGDGGPATRAAMNQPHGVAVDSEGNLYIADSGNDRIRRVDRQGVITTIAGNGTPGATGDDGPAVRAQVKDPKSMVMGSRDRLYFADTGNNRVRVIHLGNGTITTVAGVTRSGSDGDGGPAHKAALNSPRGVWVTSRGVVYIADSDNHKVRVVDRDGDISTLAGTGTAGYRGDGGQATKAQLNDPRGITVDGDGNVYIAEEAGQRIRRVDRDGTITTLAGDGTAGYAGDGGHAGHARFDHIRALSMDESANLWIADTFNNRVRVIADVADTPPPPPTTTTTVPPPNQKAAPAPRRTGYWMLGLEGRIYPFGDAERLGDVSGSLPRGVKAVHVEPTPTGRGYWILDSGGDVHPFGDAVAVGGIKRADLERAEQITSLSATPSGEGYWIFTTRGRVFPFGDARAHGDMAGTALNGPVLSSVATPTGKGYYMVASDGGVFAFGDAGFRGSMGGVALNAPVQSLVPDARGTGYWLVASDGGIFAFGSAPFRGSMGDTRLNRPVVGMVRYGNGYLMVAADGGIFNFSDRPFSGSLGDDPPARPVVAVATLDAA